MHTPTRSPTRLCLPQNAHAPTPPTRAHTPTRLHAPAREPAPPQPRSHPRRCGRTKHCVCRAQPRSHTRAPTNSSASPRSHAPLHLCVRMYLYVPAATRPCVGVRLCVPADTDVRAHAAPSSTSPPRTRARPTHVHTLLYTHATTYISAQTRTHKRPERILLPTRTHVMSCHVVWCRVVPPHASRHGRAAPRSAPPAPCRRGPFKC